MNTGRVNFLYHQKPETARYVELEEPVFPAFVTVTWSFLSSPCLLE